MVLEVDGSGMASLQSLDTSASVMHPSQLLKMVVLNLSPGDNGLTSLAASQGIGQPNTQYTTGSEYGHAAAQPGMAGGNGWTTGSYGSDLWITGAPGRNAGMNTGISTLGHVSSNKVV